MLSVKLNISIRVPNSEYTCKQIRVENKIEKDRVSHNCFVNILFWPKILLFVSRGSTTLTFTFEKAYGDWKFFPVGRFHVAIDSQR